MHKKPTEPFGHIAFGKDGSVRRHIEVLPDKKAEQESSVAERFAEMLGRMTDKKFEADALEEYGHDFLLKCEGREVVVQQTEVVWRDYLHRLTVQDYVDGNHGYSDTVHEGAGTIYGVDLAAKTEVLAEKIKRKRARHYAKPTRPFWLLIWTVRVDLLPFYSSGGQNCVSAGVVFARDYVAREGTGPFDEIWFFYPESRPHRIWPI